MSKTDLALEGGTVLTSVSNPVLSAVLASGKIALGIVRQQHPNADDGIAAFIAEEIHEAVFTQVPMVEKRLKLIEERLGDKPSATQIALVYEAFVRGFAKADGKKRGLLLNALVNAFDPELYRSR